jgi:hypothetical protein
MRDAGYECEMRPALNHPIDKIIDQRTRGRGKQFLVRWLGYGPEADLWLP